MAKIIWEPGDYEAGLDRGVSYPDTGFGMAWNGLVSVTEDPSESDERVNYLDGVRFRQRRRLGEFSGNVTAFTYPPGLDLHGFAYSRSRPIGISYRVASENSYKIHLVYNAMFSPINKSYAYDNVAPFVWNITTRSVAGPEGLRVSHLIIDSGVAYNTTISELETILYGSDVDEPRLPTPLEVYELFEENAILRIIDHGDGRWTATGPDEAITVNPDGTFEITWPSAIFINATTYKISSL